MTTFDLLMNLVWLWLAGCFGLWVWIISKWLRFEIKDRRDQRDSELQSTKVFPCRRETAGLDTQLGNLRGIRNGRDYRSLQRLVGTEDHPTKVKND